MIKNHLAKMNKSNLAIERIYGHTGFLLDKIILKHSEIFGDHFELNFFDEDDLKATTQTVLSKPYTTLIIGPNGTGKSILLKIISDILLDVNNLKTRDTLIDKNPALRRHNYDYFYISYYVGGHFVEVKNYNSETEFTLKKRKFDFQIYIDGQIKDFQKAVLPERILVSSTLLTDRFTVYKDAPEMYKYLGVRTSTSPTTAKTRNYIKRTVEHVVSSLATLDTEIINKIKDLLIFLNFEENFTIYYLPRYKDKFFTGVLDSKAFINLFENYNDKDLGFSSRENISYLPFGVDYYKRHVSENPKLINEIVEFVNEIKKSGGLKKDSGSRSEYFEYDILRSELSLDKYALLEHLSSLDLISYPSIGLTRKDNYIDLEQTSSGEYHFISTMIGIYASLKQNSIILVDEPEVSLHPNWQMRYMTFLKKIFEQFSSCQFILATHSHFLVSDLEGESSKVIGLTQGDGIEVVLFNKNLNTFGWSAEEVLLKVFKVTTSRNYYVAEKLGLILDFIADEKSTKNTIKDKFFELELDKLSGLTEEDPLKTVYDKIVSEYVS